MTPEQAERAVRALEKIATEVGSVAWMLCILLPIMSLIGIALSMIYARLGRDK